jgi:hypothetical protein
VSNPTSRFLKRAKMSRTPREEFLPLFGGEGFMVVFPPTARIALPFNVVGKADMERLGGKMGSRKLGAS